MKITLSKRQHSLLMMDCYAEYEEGQRATMDGDNPWGGQAGTDLRNALRSGRVVEVTPFLISELREFISRTAGERGFRDDEMYAEHRVFLRILKKAGEAQEKEKAHG